MIILVLVGLIGLLSVLATVIMIWIFDIPWQLSLSIGISYICIGIYGKCQQIKHDSANKTRY